MNKDYDANKTTKPYLLATFGSGWAVVLVKINNTRLTHERPLGHGIYHTEPAKRVSVVDGMTTMGFSLN